MQISEKLEAGKFYHIYNQGINSANIFLNHHDFHHFLKLYDKYIVPIADTYSFVLMPNHFHLLIRIKERILYRYSIEDKTIDPERFNDIKWETVEFEEDLSACEAPDSVRNSKIPKPHLHLSHLCNAYTKNFNKRHDRHGALFERSFKRTLVEDQEYLKKLVLYIHQNPVHHGFCEHPAEYPWSSYLACISSKPSKLHREKVLGWFDGKANFMEQHNLKSDPLAIENWLKIK